MPTFTTAQLAEKVSGRLIGPGNVAIAGLEQLDRAGPSQLSFIRDARQASRWSDSKAGAALVGPEVKVEPGPGRAFIVVPNADLALAAVLECFMPAPDRPQAGAHPTAVVDPSATLEPGVAIGPYCVIGPRAFIGAGAVLHAHVVVMAESRIGARCELYPGVVVRDRCTLGPGCILHPNVVIGADGFGYRPGPKGLVKIPHIGTVEIGTEVEIGAGTCIDRGKFSATIIGDGCKIDNQVQIAHNCVLGKRCILAGQVGLAGSVILGDGVMVGGQAGFRDHVNIGAGTQIAGSAAVASDIPANSRYGGYPAKDVKVGMREVMAVARLPDMLRPLNELIKRMKDGSADHKAQAKESKAANHHE